MPPRKAPAKKAAPKKAAPKKATAKDASPKKATAKKAPAPKTAAAKTPAKKAAAPRRAPGSPPAERAPVQRTRVVIAMDFYEPQKDDIKAPLREHELKWTFLGEGKGLYKRADSGVHCFTQFKDDGVHYSIWGDDKKAVNEILSSWRQLLGEAGWARATASGEQATAEEQQQKESDAMRLWRLGEPQRRAGEPDLFFQKRLAEWQAKKPA